MEYISHDLMDLVPEYNPSKFRIAAKVTKIYSISMILVMVAIAACILVAAFLSDTAFVVDVNGIPTKQWLDVVSMFIMNMVLFGAFSIWTWFLHRKFKAANAIFSEPDPQKRLAMVLSERERKKESSRCQF